MAISLEQLGLRLIPRLQRPRSVGRVPILGLTCLLVCTAFAPIRAASEVQENSPAYKRTLLAIQEKIETGDLQGARILVRNASSIYPHDGGIENLLGVIEIQQGNTAAASKAFSDAIEHNPGLTSAYLNLSRINMEKAATDPEARREALRLTLKAVQLEPGNDEAHYQAATILSWDKQYRSSLQHLQKLSVESQAKIGAEALLCADYAAIGERDKTSEAAQAMQANPELTEQDADTCLSNLRLARRADLIELLFGAVAAHQPLSPEGLRILGLAQEAQGKLPLARSTLESAFAGNSKSVDILEDLARVAKAIGDNQGALGYVAHARDLQPENSSLAFEFAVICVRMGLFAEARKALTEALRLEPNNPDYNLGMGIVVSFSADPSQAMPYLAKYHQVRPQDPKGVLELGAANYRAKDFDTAAGWFRQAASNKNTAADAHYYLGRIARQEGQLETATSELKQVLALEPGQPDALAELGQICVQNHDFDQAGSYFNQALGKDPDNYAANFGLLQLYARTADARRDQQARRFEEIKNMKQEQEKEMMRVIEIRPNPPLEHQK
jgi:tetratricopeptide (TPR) repeat protein